MHKLILLLLFSVLYTTGMLFMINCNRNDRYETEKNVNQTASYLENAEIQFETEQQKNTLLKVFKDIQTIPPDSLELSTYPDYKGQKSIWSIQQVLYRYIVPDKSNKKLGYEFYSELKTKEVQTIIKQMEEQLQNMESVDR